MNLHKEIEQFVNNRIKRASLNINSSGLMKQELEALVVTSLPKETTQHIENSIPINPNGEKITKHMLKNTLGKKPTQEKNGKKG